MKDAPDYYKITITRKNDEGKIESFECDADDVIRALIKHNNLDINGMKSPYYYNALKYLWRCGCKENFEKDIRKSITYLNKMINEE